jgi:hypothetical protein
LWRIPPVAGRAIRSYAPCGRVPATIPYAVFAPYAHSRFPHHYIPNHHVIKLIRGSYGNRTHNNRFTACDVTITTNEPSYSRQDSNLQPLRSRRSIQPLECCYVLPGCVRTNQATLFYLVHGDTNQGARTRT